MLAGQAMKSKLINLSAIKYQKISKIGPTKQTIDQKLTL